MRDRDRPSQSLKQRHCHLHARRVVHRFGRQLHADQGQPLHRVSRVQRVGARRQIQHMRAMGLGLKDRPDQLGIDVKAVMDVAIQHRLGGRGRGRRQPRHGRGIQYPSHAVAALQNGRLQPDPQKARRDRIAAEARVQKADAVVDNGDAGARPRARRHHGGSFRPVSQSDPLRQGMSFRAEDQRLGFAPGPEDTDQTTLHRQTEQRRISRDRCEERIRLQVRDDKDRFGTRGMRPVKSAQPLTICIQNHVTPNRRIPHSQKAPSAAADQAPCTELPAF